MPFVRLSRCLCRVPLLSVAGGMAGRAGQSVPRGRQPYQDLSLLFAARNRIAHQRPEVATTETSPTAEGAITHKHVDLSTLAMRLIARMIISKPDESVMTSELALLQDPGLGQWSVRTADSASLAVAGFFPDGASRSRLLNPLQPIPSSVPKRPKRRVGAYRWLLLMGGPACSVGLGIRRSPRSSTLGVRHLGLRRPWDSQHHHAADRHRPGERCRPTWERTPCPCAFNGT
jgi:hypothetical protein